MAVRRLRTVACLLIALVLLCVPGMTRASQRLDTHGPIGSRTQPIGFFSKSGDLPPDAVVILPDATIASWLITFAPAPRPIALRRGIVDAPLPKAPPPQTLRSPRPPPSFLVF